MKKLLPGEQITVLQSGTPMRVRTAGPVTESHVRWYGYTDPPTQRYGYGEVGCKEEGITWARGWSTDDVRAMLAASLLLAG